MVKQLIFSMDKISWIKNFGRKGKLVDFNRGRPEDSQYKS